MTEHSAYRIQVYTICKRRQPQKIRTPGYAHPASLFIRVKNHRVIWARSCKCVQDASDATIVRSWHSREPHTQTHTRHKHAHKARAHRIPNLTSYHTEHTLRPMHTSCTEYMLRTDSEPTRLINFLCTH